jgi:hypothetical protein
MTACPVEGHDPSRRSSRLPNDDVVPDARALGAPTMDRRVSEMTYQSRQAAWVPFVLAVGIAIPVRADVVCRNGQDFLKLRAGTNCQAGETKLPISIINNNLVQFSGANVQVVSGAGSTGAPVNGLGNLIVGYNANTGAHARTGSHNVVVGDEHTYTSYAGAVFGETNTISGPAATVTGGAFNEASGDAASVAGGEDNHATGEEASVGGGQGNFAVGEYAWVGGGSSNTAAGYASGVSGGTGGHANGGTSSVFGGSGNVGAGWASTAGGGGNNAATAGYDTVIGGAGNRARGSFSIVSGGENNVASGFKAVVSGGQSRSATGTDDWVAGGLVQDF